MNREQRPETAEHAGDHERECVSCGEKGHWYTQCQKRPFAQAMADALGLGPLAASAPAQELPPLPDPYLRFQWVEGVPLYSAVQIHAYALQAIDAAMRAAKQGG